MSTIALTSLLAVLLAAGPARADVDPTDTVGDLVTSALGPRSCAMSIGTPTQSGGFVRVTGSVGCTSPHAQVKVEVCLQVKQGVASEDETWQTYACSPGVRSGSSVSATASGPCLPGTWDYRGFLQADGYGNSSQPVWTAWVTGPTARISCPFAG